MPRLIREQYPDSSHCGRFRQFFWPECRVLCALCRNQIRVENSKVYIPSKETLISVLLKHSRGPTFAKLRGGDTFRAIQRYGRMLSTIALQSAVGRSAVGASTPDLLNGIPLCVAEVVVGEVHPPLALSRRARPATSIDNHAFRLVGRQARSAANRRHAARRTQHSALSTRRH